MTELRDMNIPDRAMLLNPWLQQGGLCMIAAGRGTGKTFFAMALSLAVAKGGEFLKWYNPEAQEVLYIDGEMELAEMRERFAALDINYHEIKTLSLLSHQTIFDNEQRDLNIDSKDFQDRIKNEAEKRPNLRLVVIDNLSCLTPNISENDRDDWAKTILPFLMWFRRRNIAVIILHHTGTNGKQRGTSSREDQLSVVVNLEKVQSDDDSEAQGAHFIMRFGKTRSFGGDDAAPIEITIKDGKFDFKTYTEGLRERFLSMAAEGIDNVSDMAESLGCTKGAVSKIKAKLQKQGILLKGPKIKPR